MLLSAFMTLCGAGFTAVGFGHAAPALARHEWLKKLVAWTLLVALGLLVLATLGVVMARVLL